MPCAGVESRSSSDCGDDFEKSAVRPCCDVDLDVPARDKECPSHKEIEKLQDWTTLHLFGWPVEPLSCFSSGHLLYVLHSSKLCDPKQCPVVLSMRRALLCLLLRLGLGLRIPHSSSQLGRLQVAWRASLFATGLLLR